MSDYKSTLNPIQPNQAYVYQKYLDIINDGTNLYNSNRESIQDFNSLDASYYFFDEKNYLLGLTNQLNKAKQEQDFELESSIDKQIKNRLQNLDLDDQEMAYLYYNWDSISKQEVSNFIDTSSSSSSSNTNPDLSNDIWNMLENGQSKEQISNQYGDNKNQSQIDYLYTSHTTISEYADASYRAFSQGQDHSQEMNNLERK